MRFSIIIPVYNVEAVLTRCVDSVLSQTFTDFECLLIDDGSKDQSGAICDQYAQKDSRIKVIHQVNSGVSTARNAGILTSNGEYIVFIDSDDYIQKDFLERLACSNADLSVTGYQIEGYGLTRPLFHEYQAKVTNEISDNEFLHFFANGIFNYVWAKSFRSDIIKKYNILFNGKLCFAEDTLFVVQYMKYCKSIELIPEIGYHYVKYEHETLACKNLTSETTIHKIEMANEQIYDTLAEFSDEKAMPAMLHRMGAIYKDVLLSVHSTPTCSKSFIKMLFRQKWFRLVLENADTLFPEENSKYRAILKTKSSFLFWLYYRISHK